MPLFDIEKGHYLHIADQLGHFMFPFTAANFLKKLPSFAGPSRKAELKVSYSSKAP